MSIGLISAVLLADPGAAAVPEDPEVIVVTGERSDRSVRDTASSVVVFTAKDIREDAGADRLDQLLEETPNVTFGTTSLGPTIRGQNTTGVLQDLPAFLGGNRQRVTLQVDGRAVSYNEFVYGTSPLWDVAQVEVFRSPQSTTQGRNSIAGAIFIETEDPTFTPQARIRAIYGDISMHQLSGVVSAPVIKDQLALRVAGDVRIGRPASKITDRMVGADPDHDNYGQLRIKLLAEPESAPDLRVELSLVHSRSKMPQVEGVRAPFRQRRDPMPTYGIFGTRTSSATARADYRFSQRLRSKTTLSFGDGRFQRFALPGLGEAVNKFTDWSIEDVLQWQPTPVIDVILGAHHLQSVLDQKIDLTAVIGLGKFDDVQHSTGLFGEATIRPAARLSLTAGIRYQRDSQRRIGDIGNSLFRLPLDYDETFHALLPKFSVAYDILPELTVGVLAQRAYNPGGTTLNFNTGNPELFGPEYAWSYELFARASVGRARVSANLFRTEFRDAQRAQSRAYSVPGGGTAFWAEIENVPGSRSSGAELAADWRLTDLLQIATGLGFLSTRITRTVDPANPIKGKEFQRSPHFTATGSINWNPADSVQLSVSGRHHSRYFSTDTNAEALLIKAHTIVNARASWSVGQTTLFAYARNIFDTFYMTHLSALNFGTAIDPRELGVGAEVKF